MYLIKMFRFFFLFIKKNLNLHLDELYGIKNRIYYPKIFKFYFCMRKIDINFFGHLRIYEG